MRIISFVILMVLLGTVGIFAVQNQQVMTINFLSWSMTCPLALLILIAYLLGTITGWQILNTMRSSFRRVSTPVEHREPLL